MTPRKKQPEKTRQGILDAADASFSLRGYSATGLGGIVTEAGMTKGALFHHFPDKCSLAAAWITERLGGGIESLWITPLSQVTSLNAFRSVCQARAKELRADDATSALVALAAEVAATDEKLRAALELVFTAWQSAFRDALERGKSTGWIHRSIKPEVEAAFLVSTFSGFSVAIKWSAAPSTRTSFLTALEGYLETLRGEA
jgi:TetR/AcrR family transcriptional regulator, transcriptional repressor for nem operon